MTEELPGGPRKKLVREVRSHLWQYLRSRPHRTDRAWIAAWEWAYQCRIRRDKYCIGRPDPWPSATEIATQYIFLALAEMRSLRMLRLPMYAEEVAAKVPMINEINDFEKQLAALPGATSNRPGRFIEHEI